MITTRDESAEQAKELMQEFSEETGLSPDSEKEQDRYLWTDAFAVQNYLALSTLFDNDQYNDLAERLIDNVHETLGRFASDDPRNGWISGLDEEEGSEHPTAGGLRIGKPQLERKKTEPRDSEKEWDKDGQYYHYHTRWIQALLCAAGQLNRKEFIENAAELSLAGQLFLQRTDGHRHLFWKMSIDLCYPQVLAMGAHDPLDGYLSARSCQLVSPDHFDFSRYLKNLEDLCAGKNWQTTDPLGLGGLLLNTVRAARLSRHTTLPESVRPEKLFRDVLTGLDAYDHHRKPDIPAAYRLAFRECGLSLGLRVADGHRDILASSNVDDKKLDRWMYLTEETERFWSDPDNRADPAYRDHLTINHVSLASSLLARSVPSVFSAPLPG